MAESKPVNDEITEEEEKLFGSFHHPIEIQRYIDGIRYNDASNWKSPRYVLREGTANCGEGACLAAAIFKYMGYDPLVVDMAVVDDDEHVLAVYKERDHWGAVGKSNPTLLRFREPVFRTIRELIMSYFEFYFNVKGFKSLRRFSPPLNLDEFEPPDWITTELDLHVYVDQWNKHPYETILTEEMERNLTLAEPEVVKACFLGASKGGLYVPQGFDMDRV